ncbi:MAG: hypothetical protein ACO27R_09570, partial [Hylemonella sp.]
MSEYQTPTPPEQSPGGMTRASDQKDAPVWERNMLEKLAFAALAEQRHARRWRNGWRIFWLALIFLLFWAGFGMGERGKHPSSPHTAMIEIKGEIASGGEASADLLVRGTPDQVRQRTLECIKHAAPRVVIASANAVLHGTPV